MSALAMPLNKYQSPIRLMIIGHARHGKDTVAELLSKNLGLKFTSSSEFACQLFIYKALRYTRGYKTIEECFNDRVNHRALWHQLIKEYQGGDKTKLTQAIFAENDIYCGCRAADEVQAAKDAGLVDLVIWVDASRRLPPEPIESCTVTLNQADFVIGNHGTLEQLQRSVSHITLEELRIFAQQAKVARLKSKTGERHG